MQENDLKLQPTVANQADHYQTYCCRNARAHYITADNYQKRHYWIGIPAMLASTIVGTAIFASISEIGNNIVTISAGCLSIAAALLSGLLTFLNYGDRSKDHKNAAAKYSSLRRDFEMLLMAIAYGKETSVDHKIEELKVIVEKLSEIANESPNVPEKFWKDANKEVPVPAAHESPITIAIRENFPF